MKFSESQKKTFGTTEGAYSFVTEREYEDSQITLTADEAEVVTNHFGNDNIHVGNVKSNEDLSAKKFMLFPSGEPVNLNLVYPKPGKGELRLYISEKAGFKPLANNVCFIYSMNGEIWIGEMTENEWRSETSYFNDDDDDFEYQNRINNDKGVDDKAPEKKTVGEKEIYPRDRNIAKQRFELAKYKCEFDPAHELFISRSKNFPYLEAHHLIPMKAQDLFPEQTLDTTENVFALCPRCHRAIHHAEPVLARSIIDKLVYDRPVIDDYGLVKEDLYQLYSVEEIK